MKVDEQNSLSESTQEIVTLAALMAQAFRDQTQFYQDEFGLSLQEAYAKATAPAEDAARLMDTPADRLCWQDLTRLMKVSPEKGMALWQRVKQAARDELRSGQRAATMVDRDGSPWTRAQFLVLREFFVADWQPRNGTEHALIDVLAQVYTSYQFWLERLTLLSTSEAKVMETKMAKNGTWEPPRIETAAAMEQAVTMVVQLNQAFLRTVRTLRSLRCHLPMVTTESTGQAAVGSQQVVIDSLGNESRGTPSPNDSEQQSRD